MLRILDDLNQVGTRTKAEVRTPCYVSFINSFQAPSEEQTVASHTHTALLLARGRGPTELVRLLPCPILFTAAVMSGLGTSQVPASLVPCFLGEASLVSYSLEVFYCLHVKLGQQSSLCRLCPASLCQGFVTKWAVPCLLPIICLTNIHRVAGMHREGAEK